MSPTCILVIDDDMELNDGIRAVLEKQGHRVLQARDGQQGKNLVYQHRPDLIILDMMMPRMGGFPVLEHFRGKADAPPIIMITANEGSRHKAYAEYLGAFDYIRKPFAMERLLESIHAATSRAQPSHDTPTPAFKPLGERKHGTDDTSGNRTTEPLSFDYQVHSSGTCASPNSMMATVPRMTQALSEIVGGFCHDLTNHLQSVFFALRELQGDVARARQCLVSADDTIRDLHQFVRQYYRSDPEPLRELSAREINPVLEGLLTPALGTSLAQLDIDTSRVEESFRFPRVLLRHLVVPLVTNAAEAIDRTGRKGQLQVTLKTSSSARNLQIRVEDNGPGWGGHLEEIEKGIRAGRAVSTKGSSRGHGLQNLFRIVHKLGGQLQLEDNGRRGARVRILLPAAMSNLEETNSFAPRMTQALSEIVGGFCHDLTNHLQSVFFALRELQGDVARARQCLVSADDTIRDLHQFVRQYYRSDPEPLRELSAREINPVLEGLLTPALGTSLAQLDIDTSRVEESFRFPRVLLRHLVVPLVTNAAEAIDRTGRKGQLQVTLKTSSSARNLQIRVEDNGPGWGGHLEEIEKGIRAGRAVSTKGSSRGHGLQNLFRIVHKLGGQLQLEDNGRRGARVRILLPLEGADA